MPTLLQAIGQILRPGLVQRGPIRLEETAPDSTCDAITLHKSGQAFVLKPDQCAGGICPRPGCALTLNAPDRLFPLFRLDIAGLSAMCDYILFCQETTKDDSRLFVLLCELKSENVGGSWRQLENGRLLADYILATAIHHHAVRPLPAVERRGLVFSPKFNVPKGSLRKRRCSYLQILDGFADMPFAYYASGAEYPLEHFCA
ncbi:hypothetical protein [Sorangium sp. So ce1153]|uniref:hypothetical protein n=1 Tax=Sorangium sp. So ce1153 TaxID=3133333 RepID=UPI003F604740